MHDAVDVTREAGAIDDCWNRIGIRGDQSCERLAEVQRCLNCPVYASGAARLLDRPLTRDELADAARRGAEAPSRDALEHEDARESVLAFRIGDEWLALPTGVVRQILDDRPIHSLPDRRSRAVLGIVNVRGTLRIAVSLANLFEIEVGPARAADGVRGAFTRMLVVAHRGEPVVFPVDEVEGVLRFGAAERTPPPATVARAGVAHTRAVFAWRDRVIGLIDEDRLFDTLLRSLR